MEEPAESRVIRKFRQRLERGELTENVKLMYRVEGGMPSQRLEEELRLSGRGRAYARRLDVLQSIPDEQVAADLDPDEVAGFLREFESTLNSWRRAPRRALGPIASLVRSLLRSMGNRPGFTSTRGSRRRGDWPNWPCSRPSQASRDRSRLLVSWPSLPRRDKSNWPVSRPSQTWRHSSKRPLLLPPR